jgi:hypothetical protein
MLEQFLFTLATKAVDMYKEKIVNVETGKEIWRDYTDAEIAEVEKAQAEAQAKVEMEAEAQAKREIAEAKLVALGLTADDLRALGL